MLILVQSSFAFLGGKGGLCIANEQNNKLFKGTDLHNQLIVFIVSFSICILFVVQKCASAPGGGNFIWFGCTLLTTLPFEWAIVGGDGGGTHVKGMLQRKC